MQLKYKSIFYFYKIKCTYYAFLLENIFLTTKKEGPMLALLSYLIKKANF